ncbi:P-loop containing nucleoside triphosphate hydrolase protein [Gaertneriomyces semiglobifer]|nr:P-loop containing nucleoside triphosphate hydrolase protein [Gaertneriomyces semiglobifer]
MATEAKEPLTFPDLGVSPWLTQTLHSVGIQKPTEIQRKCIPEILKGRDCVGSAATGSGKTAAFAVPILEKLAQDIYGVFAVVLTPTRELAFQIAEQFRVLGVGINLRVSIVVGGMDMTKQALELCSRPHVIIATPGRLADHVQSTTNALRLGKVKFLVIDEADRLLTDTFANDMEVVLDALPKERQTLLFSATMEIGGWSKDAFVWHCGSGGYEQVEKLDQRYMFLSAAVRDTYLAHLCRDMLEGKSMIVFTGKCWTCEYVRQTLRELGVQCVALHGQMTQAERLASLAKFRSGISNVLIATDVGSRGLDIPTVQVVLNYEFPASAADYVHRVGRTARAGRGGMSVSFITQYDIDLLKHVEDKIGKELVEYEVDEKDVLEALEEVSAAGRIAKMFMLDTNFGERKRIHKEKQGGGKVVKKRKSRSGKAERAKRSKAE